MTEPDTRSRRVLLGGALSAGAILALLRGTKGRADPPRIGERQMFASWVHGTAGHVQHTQFSLTGGDDTAVAIDTAGGILRFGWGAEVYFRAISDDLDTRLKDFRSGGLWVHYAIPTPVIEGGRRAVARDLIVKWSSPDNTSITISELHVWDGDSFLIPPLVGVWGDPEEPTRRISLGDRSVNWGIGVSLHIKGNHVNFQKRLKIHSIGVDFFA
jgi:hypothetical protein